MTWFKSDIAALGLTNRPYNALRGNGIHTVGQLVEQSERSLSKMGRLGRTSLREIKRCLSEHGLALVGDSDKRCRSQNFCHRTPRIFL